MIRLLRQDGVRFPDNKVLHFQSLDPLAHSVLHAEGEWGDGDSSRRCAVAFGPQYGPITAKQVEECLWAASRGGYDDLVLAGFTIDGAAQALIQEDPNPRVRCHLAHIRPDVHMGDLLKDTPSSQLFTVFGLPRASLEQTAEEGVDRHHGGRGHLRPGAATPSRPPAPTRWPPGSWIATTTGRPSASRQAFFPDRAAWDKLARALKTVVDPERFEAFSGTRSLPFPAGEHRRVAVKVIDPRGNEVMRVLSVGARCVMSDAILAKMRCPSSRSNGPSSAAPMRSPHGALGLRHGRRARRSGSRAARPASYWFKTQRVLHPATDCRGFAEEEREDLPLVNALREDVKRWRDSDYEGATPGHQGAAALLVARRPAAPPLFLPGGGRRDGHLPERDSPARPPHRAFRRPSPRTSITAPA